MSARLLWVAAVAALAIGTALVFAAVAGAGLFTVGAVMIDIALLLAAAAGVLQLRGGRGGRGGQIVGDMRSAP